MYSTRPNKFVSHLSGKEFPFDATGKRGPADKARALNALEAHHAEIERAFTARNQRPPKSLRELRDGAKEPDTRSVRQRVEEEVQFAQKPGETGNPYSRRIVELEKAHKYASTPQQRGQFERKLAALRDASDQWDEKQAEKRTFEQLLQSAPVQRAITHAESVLQRLLADENSSEAEIAEARNRLAALKATGQVDQYHQAYEEFEQRAKSALQQRNAEMEAKLADIRAEYGIGEGSSGLVESQAFGASEIEE